MSLFPYPSVSQVRLESDLRPNQVSTAFTEPEQIDADLKTRLDEEAAKVETDFLNAIGRTSYPLTSDFLAIYLPGGNADTENARIAALGTLAFKKLMLHDLYESSGQLSKAYPDRADRYMTQYRDALDAIAKRLAFITEHEADGDSIGGGGGGTVSLAPYRVNEAGVLVVNA